MELFKNIRLKIGKCYPVKKGCQEQRERFIIQISDMVKNIGIVWDASKTDEFPVLSRFHQKMHERNIDVKIIGYFPGKKLPDQYTAIRYLTCIKKDELNFFYHPVFI